MARIRTIKPEFFMSEDVLQLSIKARLCYVGLWCHADREGKLKYNKISLSAQIMPKEIQDFEGCIEEMQDLGLVIKYEVENKQYLVIPTFLEHQKPHHSERPSKIPNPLTVKRRLKDGYMNVNHSQEREKEREKERERNTMSVGFSEKNLAQEIFNFWNNQNIIVHKSMNLKNGNEKYENIIKRLSKDYQENEIKQSILNYSTIMKNESGKYRDVYKWTLPEFLVRGFDKYIDWGFAHKNALIFKAKQENELSEGDHDKIIEYISKAT